MTKNNSIKTASSSTFQLWEQLARISVESQLVIGLRVAGMLGLVAQAPGEPFRMIAEKQAAASESLLAVAQAASRGASPEQVLSEALGPYDKRISANSRRLTRQS